MTSIALWLWQILQISYWLKHSFTRYTTEYFALKIRTGLRRKIKNTTYLKPCITIIYVSNYIKEKGKWQSSKQVNTENVLGKGGSAY